LANSFLRGVLRTASNSKNLTTRLKSWNLKEALLNYLVHPAHLIKQAKQLVLQRRRWARQGAGLFALALMALSLALWNGPVAAQRIKIDEIGQQIYQQLPDLPLENQYISDETGDVSPTNTLVKRLIRYHIYTKSRSPAYRLDWKLTIADYLGANERIEPNTYPSATGLRDNPAAGDIAAMQSLTLAQRTALVDALTLSFNPASAATPDPAPEPSPQVAPSPSPAPVPRFPRQPQPGDADLLQP
jgi:hypothetical protein